jgi:hypothetical protein
MIDHPRSGVIMPQKKRTRTTPRRKAAGDAPKGCGYVVEFRPLTSLEGLTPIWITNAQYEKVAAALAKKTKDKHARKLLRARAHPLGVTYVCSGTCSGGWCKEQEVPPDDDSAVAYVCDCAYFV